MSAKFFGQFLLEQGAVTGEQLLAAVKIQESTNVLLGTRAIDAGLMTAAQVEEINSMQRTVEKNFHRLIQEVKETGELSVLLTRAARGQKLTREERKAMREQLIDVAKVIPALAIFAAPGGILLLIALAKVLPFNILPSAFQDQPDEKDPSDIEKAS